MRRIILFSIISFLILSAGLVVGQVEEAKSDSGKQSIKQPAYQQPEPATKNDLVELKEKFYDEAVKGLESQKTWISILLGLVGVVIAYGFVRSWSLKREFEKERSNMKETFTQYCSMIEKEYDLSKNQRLEIEKEIARVREIADNAEQRIGEATKRVTTQEEELNERIGSLVRMSEAQRAKIESKATVEEIKRADLKEKIDLIPEDDAKDAIKEYESLLNWMSIEEIDIKEIPKETHLIMGHNYSTLEQYGKAISEYRKCLEHDPDNEKAHLSWGFALGWLYERDGGVAFLYDAIKKFKRVTEINPKGGSAYRNWGVALCMLYEREHKDGLLRDAIPKYQMAIEFMPEHANSYYGITSVYSLLGERNNMLESLRKAIYYDVTIKADAREDKDFEKYWTDPDFIELTKPDDEEDKGDKGGEK